MVRLSDILPLAGRMPTRPTAKNPMKSTVFEDLYFWRGVPLEKVGTVIVPASRRDWHVWHNSGQTGGGRLYNEETARKNCPATSATAAFVNSKVPFAEVVLV